jgi:hypothetical protein
MIRSAQFAFLQYNTHVHAVVSRLCAILLSATSRKFGSALPLRLASNADEVDNQVDCLQHIISYAPTTYLLEPLPYLCPCKSSLNLKWPMIRKRHRKYRKASSPSTLTTPPGASGPMPSMQRSKNTTTSSLAHQFLFVGVNSTAH